MQLLLFCCCFFGSVNCYTHEVLLIHNFLCTLFPCTRWFQGGYACTQLGVWSTWIYWVDGETRPQLLKGWMALAFESQLIQGNGYETRQTSKGLTKEQTLILRRTSTLHNLLLYSHLTDQIETLSLAYYSIYAEMFLFCAGSRLKKVNKKIEQWVS